MRYIVTAGSSLGKEAERTDNTLTSSIKFEKISMEEGKLYRYLIPASYDRTIIGEATNDSIYSALAPKRTYGLVLPIRMEDVNVYIFSSDGKQTHRDLVDENMGGVFPIKEITTHDKYKYIVEIDKTNVALSCENVVFIPKPTTDSLIKGVVECDGMVGNVMDSRSYYGSSLLYIRDLFSSSEFFMFKDLVKENKEYQKVHLSGSCVNELKQEKIEFTNTRGSGVVSGYASVMGKFGYDFIVQDPGNMIRPNIIYTKEIDKLHELFKNRFLFDKKHSIFYLNPKYNKTVLNEEPRLRRSASYRTNNRRGSRPRDTFADLIIDSQRSRFRRGRT